MDDDFVVKEKETIKKTKEKKKFSFFSVLIFSFKIDFLKPATLILVWLSVIVIFLLNLVPSFLKSLFPIDTSLQFVLLISPILITVFSGFMAIFRTINIFQETQENGLDILICTKPINRINLFLSRITYLFLFLFFYSFVILIFLIITFYLNGSNYYPQGSTYIVKQFATIVLSFIIFSSLSIFLSGFNLSIKTSRLITTLIVSFGASIAFLKTFSFPMIDNQLNNFNQNFIDYMNSQLKLKPLIVQLKNNSTISINSINVASSTLPSFILLSNNTNNNLFDSNMMPLQFNIEAWKNFILSCVQNLNNKLGFSDIINLTTLEDTIRQWTKSYMTNATINPSYIVTLSFINPISVCSILGNVTSISYPGILPNNYKYFDFKQIVGQNDCYSYSQIQIDQPSFVIIPWIILIAFFLISGFWLYLRKDYK